MVNIKFEFAGSHQNRIECSNSNFRIHKIKNDFDLQKGNEKKIDRLKYRDLVYFSEIKNDDDRDNDDIDDDVYQPLLTVHGEKCAHMIPFDHEFEKIDYGSTSKSRKRFKPIGKPKTDFQVKIVTF